jgi:hypothetical protein
VEATEYRSRCLTYQDRHEAKLIIKPTVNLTSVRRSSQERKLSTRTCVFTQISNNAKTDAMGPREEIIIAKVALEKKFLWRKAECLHRQG